MKFARPTALLLTFLLLCASVAYWAMQMLQDTPRPQMKLQEPPPASLNAAAALFGGNNAAATGSNFQLKGVINASNPEDSAAIIALNNKPGQPVKVGTELAPGVRLKQVHEKYVLLSDNGAERRLDLAAVQKKTATAVVNPAQVTVPANVAQPPQPPQPPMPRQPSVPSELLQK